MTSIQAESSCVALWWVRQWDLRIDDNPAFLSACDPHFQDLSPSTTRPLPRTSSALGQDPSVTMSLSVPSFQSDSKDVAFCRARFPSTLPRIDQQYQHQQQSREYRQEQTKPKLQKHHQSQQTNCRPKKLHRVLPVYIHAPQEEGSYGVMEGAAASAWLHYALQHFNEQLRHTFNGRLLIIDGSILGSKACLHQLLDILGKRVISLSFHAVSWPRLRERDQDIARSVQHRRVRCFLHEDGNFLYSLPEITKAMDLERSKRKWYGHYMTLMSVYRPCIKHLGPPRRPYGAPIPAAVSMLSDGCAFSLHASLDTIKLYSPPLLKDGSTVDWFAGLAAAWGNEFSENVAIQAADSFLRHGINMFEKHRNRADNPNNNSRLSPYIRFGQLSPHRVFWGAIDAMKRDQNLTSKTFERRLFWRDLANLQVMLFPSMLQQKPLRPHYEKHVWNSQQHVIFEAWKHGQTGFPIVDAAMRELYSTGWMQTNVRMAAASFLCEYANCDWRLGERWFAYTLVDADAAINSMMWQNAGRCGFDQWNFKICPSTCWQSSDPFGKYIKKWVPELQRLPEHLVGTPWKISPAQCKLCGFVPGISYPHPILAPDHLSSYAEITKEKALQARRLALQFNDAEGYDVIRAHDGKFTRVFTRKDLRLNRDGNPLYNHCVSKDDRNESSSASFNAKATAKPKHRQQRQLRHYKNRASRSKPEVHHK